VSGALERFLIARGERIVRVAPKHMAGARRSARERGKSDSIDAFSVARAAPREGLETLPGAHLDGRAPDIRLLSDHRDDLVASRTEDQQRLRWHLHDLWPELEIPRGALDMGKWLGKVSRRLARAEQTTRVRVARDLVRQRARRTPSGERSSRQRCGLSGFSAREFRVAIFTLLLGHLAALLQHRADRGQRQGRVRPYREHHAVSPPCRASHRSVISVRLASACILDQLVDQSLDAYPAHGVAHQGSPLLRRPFVTPAGPQPEVAHRVLRLVAPERQVVEAHRAFR
jgi:hypothetical protein